jgi:hypothetical protein
VDGGAAGGELVELGEFLLGGGEADGESFGFPDPALAAGFVDAGAQVVADVQQPGSLRGVEAKQWAA